MKRILPALVAAAALGATAAGAQQQMPQGHGQHHAQQPMAQQQMPRQPMHQQMQQHHAQHHGTATMSNAPASSGSHEMQQGMMGNMRHMQVMPMTGDVDKDFVRMMRQHHLQGIEMARIQAQKGDDAEAKRMAEKIIDQQQKEIAQFDDWLRKHQ